MSNQEKEMKIREKCQKDFPEFVETVDSMAAEQLMKNMLNYSKWREETTLEMSKDEALQAAKDVAKELAAPYRDTLGALKTKMAYMYVLLREKGAGGFE